MSAAGETSVKLVVSNRLVDDKFQEEANCPSFVEIPETDNAGFAEGAYAAMPEPVAPSRTQARPPSATWVPSLASLASLVVGRPDMESPNGADPKFRSLSSIVPVPGTVPRKEAEGESLAAAAEIATEEFASYGSGASREMLRAAEEGEASVGEMVVVPAAASPSSDGGSAAAPERREERISSAVPRLPASRDHQNSIASPTSHCTANTLVLAPKQSTISRWEHVVNDIVHKNSINSSRLHPVWTEARVVDVMDIIGPLRRAGVPSSVYATVNKKSGHEDPSDSGSAWVLHPFCKTRLVWDFIGLVLCLHDIVTLPMIFFDMPHLSSRFRSAYDVCSLLYWSLDLIVSFFTGFVTSEGLIETQLREVFKNYCRTWFSLDLAITMSDWSTMFVSLTSVEAFRAGKTVARTLRGLRLLRLPKMKAALQEMIGTINSEGLVTMIGVVNYTVVIIILTHYVACFWWALSDRGSGPTWRDYYVDDTDNVASAYLFSLHWAMSQFTPASMEVNPKNTLERLFACVTILFGMVIFSSFVSSITQAMTHLRQMHARKHEQEVMIRKFFCAYNISRDVAGRVKHFIHQHELLEKRRIKESEVSAFQMLPRVIRDDLKVEAFRPILCSHPLFDLYSRLDPLAIYEICANGMDEVSLMPMEEMFWDTPDVDKMIFILSGSLEYKHTDIGPELFVNKGEWACEEALWGADCIMSGPLIAMSEGCEVLAVKPKLFQTVTKAHTRSLGFVLKYAEMFIQAFNTAALDPSCTDLLFNSKMGIERLAHRAAEGFNIPGNNRRTALSRTMSAAVKTMGIGGTRTSRVVQPEGLPSPKISTTDGSTSWWSRCWRVVTRGGDDMDEF